MTFLVREVVGFLLDTTLWIALLATAATFIVLVLTIPFGRSPDRLLFGAAVVGGAVLAALAHRLGIPSPWDLEVGGRALPLTAAAVGAAATALAVMRARSDRAPSSPEGNHQG